MYVETDFLVALVREDDWLQEPATEALVEYDDLYTSILAYAELLVLLYERDEAGYDVDVPRALTNLLELVPVEPVSHEAAVLAAAAYLEDFDLTPLDALHAGVVTTRDDSILTSERDHDALGLDRVPLEDTA